MNLPKPIGVKFGRGNDGAAYVLKSDPNLGNTDEKIQVRPPHRTAPRTPRRDSKPCEPGRRACLCARCSADSVYSPRPSPS